MKTVSGVAAGVGVIMGVADTVNAFKEGDAAGGTLNATGTVGSALMMAGALGAGAAFTGIGAVLSVGALAGTLALGQYRKVQASNHFESGDTEAFLRHALSDSGLSGDEMDSVTHQLRNADSDGRLTGILIQAAAEQMSMDPDDLLNLLAQQDTDMLKYIITKGHGVDPTDENDLKSLDEQEVKDWIDLLYEQGIEGFPAR